MFPFVLFRPAIILYFEMLSISCCFIWTCNTFPNPIPSSCTLIRCWSVFQCQKFHPVIFLHTPRFSFFLPQQDIHQQFFVWLKRWGNNKALSYCSHPGKSSILKHPSGKATMVKHQSYKEQHANLITMLTHIAGKATQTSKRTFLPPGRSWWRSVCSNIAMGIPTFLERPATRTFFPTVSIPAQRNDKIC